MNTGLVLLALAYVLSQFFRAFLAVLAKILELDIGATPDDLAFASGLWFIAFAAAQIPIGASLDSLGPRRTAGWLMLLGCGGGAAVFAMATGPALIAVAMAMIGVGCAPVLMASYYIFAREHPPAQFAVLASVMVGVGSLGNLVASYPMALSAELLGWRTSLWGLGALSAMIALAILVWVRDPAKIEGEAKGSLGQLFKLKALWFIFPLMGVNYALPGAIRGLWIGPYLTDVFGADTGAVGLASLLMGIAMISGALAYGFADRFFPSRKWMLAGGAMVTSLATFTMILLPAQSLVLSVVLICAIGFFGGGYAVIMAHGRSFLPPQLIGRGVTMLNLFSIGGVGVMQFASGRVYYSYAGTGDAVLPYVMVFLLLGCCLVSGLFLYLFSRDKSD